MKLILLNLLTFLIVASALVYRNDYSEQFIETHRETLSTMPQLSANSLTTPQSKISEKFFTLPINVLVSNGFQDLQFENLTFIYYLPLYSLLRLKDYFLLI
jgi:hypothetical protein